MSLKLQQQHIHTLRELQSQVKGWSSCDSSGSLSSNISLAKNLSASNLTRSLSYKNGTRRLDVDSLHNVIRIDPERMIATCEPRVSMLKLATETQKLGFIPLVLPEFKGITVGGAIMGCGGESSSHKHGLFQDICEGYELLLGNGEVVHATKADHGDLFSAIGGSYGSLAVLTSAEIKLQRAKPWVTLTYHHFDAIDKACAKMKELLHKRVSPEFIEGIIFSKEHACIIEASPSDTPEKEIFKESATSAWFYQHAKGQTNRESMPLLDYLFRYDKGAFWMGGYVFHLPLALHIFLEGVWKLKRSRPFTFDQIQAFSILRDPGLIKRLLLSPVSSSQALYSVLRSCEGWVADRFFIQDFTLPESTILSFIDKAVDLLNIFPLWLCPVKNAQQSGLFSPHSAMQEDFSINLGVYGIPDSREPLFALLGKLERELYERGGRKWLYTHSAYSVKEFWEIYPQDEYLALRDKYSATNIWMSIEQKVLSK